MVKSRTARHELQQHIIAYLEGHGESRFRDLRTSEVDTNLLTYHLKVLCTDGLIVKTEIGYALSGVEAAGPDRGSLALAEFVVQNGDGDILLQQQPGGRLGLPRAQVDLTRAPLHEGVRLAAGEVVGLGGVSIEHAGDAYVRTRREVRFVHVFRAYTDILEGRAGVGWYRPHKLGALQIVPGTEEVMARTFFKDPFFFEEFILD
ncbi:hypothetical protein LRY29_02215 [Candidatus Saccharibacteria bacterium]|nr:hypothetical protein [Candidatus Saccharibacteria bacterium]